MEPTEEEKKPMKVAFAPGFEDSFNRLFSPVYAPLRAWKTILRIPREIKWKWQRMNRGWADCDTWGMYYHLQQMIPEMIRKLMTYKNSYPGEFKGVEEWAKVLDKMASGFELKMKWEEDADLMLGYEDDHDFHYLRSLHFNHSMSGEPMTKEEEDRYAKKNAEYFELYHRKDEEVKKQFDESFELFHKYFYALWD